MARFEAQTRTRRFQALTGLAAGLFTLAAIAVAASASIRSPHRAAQPTQSVEAPAVPSTTTTTAPATTTTTTEPPATTTTTTTTIPVFVMPVITPPASIPSIPPAPDVAPITPAEAKAFWEAYTLRQWAQANLPNYSTAQCQSALSALFTALDAGDDASLGTALEDVWDACVV